MGLNAFPGRSMTFFSSALSMIMSQVSLTPGTSSQRNMPPAGTSHSQRPACRGNQGVRNRANLQSSSFGQKDWGKTGLKDRL